MKWQWTSPLSICVIFLILLLSEGDNLFGRGQSGVEAGCVQLGRCCDGKNSSCRARGRRMNNPRSRTCFCDSNCLKMRDCCTDYYRACSTSYVPVYPPKIIVTSRPTLPPTTTPMVVENCLVGEWLPWTQCSARCGSGIKQRTRNIIRHPQNGGWQCPALVEKTACQGTGCKVPRASDSQEAIRETGKIIPAAFGGWRKSKKYDPYKDIRKNLFEHYEKKTMTKVSRPSYCAQFELIENRPSCLRSPVIQWSKLLVKGASICVECQALVMSGPQVGAGRCRGHGVMNRETRWSAVGVPGCHGKWIMKTAHTECQCDPDEQLSFVLV